MAFDRSGLADPNAEGGGTDDPSTIHPPAPGRSRQALTLAP
jgi:hypothetical protein